VRKVPVDVSDLEKIGDALNAAAVFFERRDQMNAAVHLAGQPRYSPITSNVQAEAARVGRILEEGKEL
jgi:hypothetical protein